MANKIKDLKKDFIPSDNRASDIPWMWEVEMLDSNISIRWWGSTGWSNTIKFIRPATDWNWLQTFWGFWFTPSQYEITAWKTWNAGGASTILDCHSVWWRDINWVDWWMSVRPNGANQIEVASTTSVLRCFYTNAWWWDTRASHSSFTSEGIILNFQASVEDIEFRLTCYS